MQRRDTLIVTSSFPRFKGDWAGRFVLESSRLFEPLGPVHVATPWDKASDPDFQPIGLNLHRYALMGRIAPGPFFGSGGPENLASPIRLLQAPSGLAACIGAAFRLGRNAERLVAHWMVPSGLAVALSKRANQQAMLVVHGGGWHTLRRTSAGRKLARFICRRMDHIVCVAHYQRAQILDMFTGDERREMERRIVAVPMGLDVARFSMPPKEPIEKTKPLVLGVGRLTPIKGFDRLIRACEGLPVKIRILGEGPQRGKLAAMARRLGIELELPGVRPADEVVHHYHDADVMVVPSRRISGREEGAPRVLIEAMAAGCAIVASRSGGITDLIEHGRSGLLEDGSEASLRAQLSMLLDDERLRDQIGKQAQELAWQFDWRILADDFCGPLG